MSMRHSLAVLLGATLALGAESAFSLTDVDAYFPYTGAGYNTLGVNVRVEASDIQSHNLTAWVERSIYTKNGDATQVQDSTVIKRPAVSGDFAYALIFTPQPLPGNYGMWSVTAVLALEYYRCSVYLGFPVCGSAYYCELFGAGEPCEDMASGTIP